MRGSANGPHKYLPGFPEGLLRDLQGLVQGTREGSSANLSSDQSRQWRLLRLRFYSPLQEFLSRTSENFMLHHSQRKILIFQDSVVYLFIHSRIIRVRMPMALQKLVIRIKNDENIIHLRLLESLPID